MADNLDNLKKAADAAARYYDLTLKQQDKLNDAIENGSVKSIEKLADKISKLSKKSMPEILTLIEEFNDGFETSIKRTKSISDNILSSKNKLHKLLQSTQTLNELQRESFKLQRKSIQSNALSLSQMKSALGITTRELNLRNRVADASARELSNKEVLLKVLKNAGDISPKGFQFIEDTVFGRMKKAQGLMRVIKKEIEGNADQLGSFNQQLPQMEASLKKYVSKLGYRGRLLKQQQSLKGRTDLDKSTKGSMQNDLTAKLRSVEAQLSGFGYSSYSDFKDAIDEVKDKITELTDRQTTLNNRLSFTQKVYQDERSSLDQIDRSIKGILDKRIQLESASTSINEKSKILLGLMQQATEVNEDQVALYSQYLTLLDQQQQATAEVGGEEYRMFKQRASLLEKASIIHSEIQDKIKNQFSLMSDISSFIPVIGKDLSKGFTEAGQKVSNLASEMYQGFSLTYSKTGDGAKALGAAMSKVLSKPGVALALGLTTALIAAKLVFDQIHKLSMAMEEVSKNTGLTADQALILERAGMRTQIRYDNVLSSIQDIRDAQAGIVNEAGFFLQVQNDVLNTVSNVGRAYGYGSKMAGQLQTELMMISGGSEVLAANTQVAMAAIAEAEGLAPGLIPQDILQNSETVAKYFTGYPKQLAKTVIEINKMGLGLAQLDKMMTHLLEYEKSITAEFEASVAIGRHVNVGRARDLLLQEDMLGAMEQMRKEAGSLAEFERMGFARRKLMANAMGLSVKETRKMLFVSEQLTGESDALKQSTLDNYDLIQKLSGGNQELFKVQAKNVQATQKFNTAVQKIGMAFKTSLLPLLEAMMPIISLMADAVSLLAKGIQGMLAPLSLVSSYVADVFSGEGFGGGTRTKNSVESLAFNPSEDGSLGGSIAKYVGMGVAGIGLLKGGSRLLGRGKGGGGGKSGGGLLSKIPGIGGLGRGNTPSKPMFVSLVGGGGGLMDLLGGGGRLRRGGKGAKASQFLAKGVGQRYARRFGMGAAVRRFGPAAAGLASGATKAGGGLLSKLGGKGIAKIGSKALGKSLIKKIPVLGAVAGLAFGAKRALKGDFLGAALEATSGLASTFPGLGTAASVGIDTALAARDVKRANSSDKSISKVAEPTKISTTEYENRSQKELMEGALGMSSSEIIKALNGIKDEVSKVRENPIPAILEDSTARDLNRKLKSYNGS